MNGQISKQQIYKLVKQEPENCVSIYMPIYKIGSALSQNSIRLKNLIAKAINQLRFNGLPLEEAKKILTPSENILNDKSFWQEQTDSFVMFASKQFFAFYCFNSSVKEEVLVGNRFYIRPLSSVLDEDGEFYVLALSKNHFRLLKCNQFTYDEVQPQSVPKNLKDALKFKDPERVLQYHTNTAHIPGSRGAAVFHGHGVGTDDEKDDLMEYFRVIDRGIHPVLRDENAPLILAAVDYFHPLYDRVNSYPHLFEERIPGNADLLNNQQLYDQAKQLLKPHFTKPLLETIAEFDDLEGTARVSKNVKEILKATIAGKVRKLLLQSDSYQWGKFNSENSEVESHEFAEPGDEEILNLCAIYTVRNKGKVFSTEKDNLKSPVRAIFRYS